MSGLGKFLTRINAARINITPRREVQRMPALLGVKNNTSDTMTTTQTSIAKKEDETSGSTTKFKTTHFVTDKLAAYQKEPSSIEAQKGTEEKIDLSSAKNIDPIANENVEAESEKPSASNETKPAAPPPLRRCLLMAISVQL